MSEDLQARIKAEYEAGAGPKALAEKYGISIDTIKSWIKRKKWKRGAPSAGEGAPSVVEGVHPEERATSPPKGRTGAPKGNQNAKGHGAPIGNKNAVGNDGGAPQRNKNAVRTGEHETIWLDQLDETEQGLFDQVVSDPLVQIAEEIALLSIRERRMLKRIQELMQGLSEKSRRVLQERHKTKEPHLLYDDVGGKTRTVMLEKYELVTTEIEEKEARKIDDILSIEEALTRVQAQKLKAIHTQANMIKMELSIQLDRERFEHQKAMDEARLDLATFKALPPSDEDEPTESDGYDDAMGGMTTQEVWSDDTSEES